LCLGGNLMRALPETDQLEQHWRAQELTVMVSTKLNRSHLYPGKAAFILPCLTRGEKDEQASGPQYISVEDSFSMIHGSIGKQEPASTELKSELDIVASIAEVITEPHPKRPWRDWVADYSRVRDLIEATYPDDFRDYNQRLNTPGGFWRGNPARDRIWETDSGKAEFTVPEKLNALGFDDAEGRFTLITMRSNDQFNTTIYGYSDRFRGIEGTRDVLLINEADMLREGLAKGQIVTLVSDADDGISRRLPGLEVIPFDLPLGTIGSYYPECNVLVPLSLHDRTSKTPGSKGVPVKIEKA
jgi:anaerobic selenocysteine-containing dehydrogenase